jgi:hypothetical protein
MGVTQNLLGLPLGGDIPRPELVQRYLGEQQFNDLVRHSPGVANRADGRPASPLTTNIHRVGARPRRLRAVASLSGLRKGSTQAAVPAEVISGPTS